MSVAKTLFAAAVLVSSFSGVALARDTVVTAKLAAPAEHARVISENIIWNCEADTCVGTAHRDLSVRDCRQFARQIGQNVTSFGLEGAPLTSEELARCNGEQTQTQQARN
ncbi:MAG: hypothetical protein ABUS48_05945 [Pseudomonadota bacterium]